MRLIFPSTDGRRRCDLQLCHLLVLLEVKEERPKLLVVLLRRRLRRRRRRQLPHQQELAFQCGPAAAAANSLRSQNAAFSAGSGCASTAAAAAAAVAAAYSFINFVHVALPLSILIERIYLFVVVLFIFHAAHSSQSTMFSSGVAS